MNQAKTDEVVARALAQLEERATDLGVPSRYLSGDPVLRLKLVEVMSKRCRIPYWILVDYEQPSWLVRPIWRTRAVWWRYRWIFR